MKLRQVQRQRQSQKTKLIYAASATMILALIAVFSFVFNIGNIRTGFSAPAGASITCAQSGNWNSTSTWTGGVVPTSADNVTISDGRTVTVNITNAACSSLTLGGGGTSNGTITFASTSSPSLTVTNNITSNTGTGTAYVTMVSGATLSANSFVQGPGHVILTCDFSTGTVIYTGATSTTIIATTYNNLTIASTTNKKTLAGTTTVTGTLTITSGALIESTYTLDLKGNFVNNSTFSGGTGTIIFDNNSAQTIGGSGPYGVIAQTFYNLTINNSSGVTLSAPVTVSNILTLTSGILTLGSNKLTVSGSISGGSSSSFIETNSTGVLEMTASHTSPGTVFPIGDGYNPITIQPVTADATFDVSVLNGVTDKLGATISSHSVGVTWKVVLTTGSAQNVTVTPEWFTSDELTSFGRSTSYVASRTTSPTGTWVPMSAGGAASGSNPYTRSGSISSMALSTSYYIGVGDNVGALPVTLISFEAMYENSRVSLNWATASEINNHYFEIERSTDGQIWQSVSREDGHGNSTERQDYSYTDDLAGIVPAGDIYYRLHQVDFNGAATYSMIRSVSINAPAPSSSITVYPNPTSRELNVNWNSEDNGNAMLRIVNINGATLYSENVTGMGTMHKQLDLSSYKSGTYFVQIVTDKNTSSQTVIKK